MNILAIADEPEQALWDFYRPQMTEGVDLILSCGDLKPEYLEFLVTMANCPLLYVRGNHDGVYDVRPPEGCIPIDDQIYDFHGLRILGLGGSMRYGGSRDMYTETEMSARIRRLRAKLVWMNGFDLLLTHAPAKGYGDLEDLPHRGFACFNTLLNKYRPAYMLYGHVHAAYDALGKREMTHESGTKLINCAPSRRFTIGQDEYPIQGKTGSALYDLYLSLKNRER